MSPGASRNSVRSCPTQNPRPAPVMTTARTSSSRAASFRAAWSARCIAALKAFSTSGRFSVIVWTAPSRERPIEHALALVDLRAVPERAILLLEQHELGPRAGVAARVLEQHLREQPERLGLVGHEPREQPPEPDRLVAQLAANRRPVALVEDEVENGEDRSHPV